jgi:serine/threonine protein kinase
LIELGLKFKGRKSDIWAAGVTLYYMYYTAYPFPATSFPELYHAIKEEE